MHIFACFWQQQAVLREALTHPYNGVEKKTNKKTILFHSHLNIDKKAFEIKSCQKVIKRWQKPVLKIIPHSLLQAFVYFSLFLLTLGCFCPLLLAVAYFWVLLSAFAHFHMLSRTFAFRFCMLLHAWPCSYSLLHALAHLCLLLCTFAFFYILKCEFVHFLWYL
jgi:hypothetical protein